MSFTHELANGNLGIRVATRDSNEIVALSEVIDTQFSPDVINWHDLRIVTASFELAVMTDGLGHELGNGEIQAHIRRYDDEPVIGFLRYERDITLLTLESDTYIAGSLKFEPLIIRNEGTDSARGALNITRAQADKFTALNVRFWKTSSARENSIRIPLAIFDGAVSREYQVIDGTDSLEVSSTADDSAIVVGIGTGAIEIGDTWLD